MSAKQSEETVTIIKLAFFLWLAILAGMTWVTSGLVAGEVSKLLLCSLAFVGGLIGTWAVIYQASQDE